MNYENIEAAIQEAPGGYIPDLFAACIKAGIEKCVWRPCWIGVVAERLERKIRRTLEKRS